MSLASIYPRRPLRVSDYTIRVASKDKGLWVLAHGYSGAIDKVDAATYAWIEGGLAGPPPSGETSTRLVTRGYLTRKSSEEEQQQIAGLIQGYYAQRRASSRPSVTIILSYDCNFRCTYCTQRKVQLKGESVLAKGMSDEVMDSAFRFIESTGSYDVTLFGGEPFMPGNERRVRRFAAWIREKGGTIHAVSNGHNWRDYEEVFDPALISSVQVTLDGPEEVHDRRRVGVEQRQTFATILDNVAWALARGVRVSARINTDRRNIEELAELTAIFKARGFYDHAFSCYLTPVQGNGVMKPEPLFDFREMYERMLDSHTRSCEGTAPGSVLFNADYLPALRHEIQACFENEEPLPYKFSFCSAYTTMHVLDPFGRMYACWDFVDDPDNVIGVFHPALAYEPVKLERWRGRDDGVLLKKCLSCPYVLLHGSGCQAEAFRQTGEYFERNCEDYAYQFELGVLSALEAVDVRERALITEPVPRKRSLRVVA